MLEKLIDQVKASSFLGRRRQKLIQFFIPTRRITDPVWREAWRANERRRFRTISKFFFLTAGVAYLLHFFLIDLPLGKQPIYLWASYRLGLAALSFAAYWFTTRRVYNRLSFYKMPVAIAGLIFGLVQSLTMTWYSGIPYFYAFLIPGLTTVILRSDLLVSIAYLSLCFLIQWPIFAMAGIEAHLLLSAAVVTYMAVIVFRSNMATDVNGFISEQLKDDMQHKLNDALCETKKQEKILARMNGILVRKNQVFHTLLEASAQLPHFEKLSDLLGYATSQLEKLFHDCGFAIVICEQDSRRVAEASFTNIDQDVQTFLMHHNSDLWRDSFEQKLHHLLFDRRSTAISQNYPESSVRILSLVGTADRIVGKALIIGLQSDQQSWETISLFLALVTSCAENLVLTKRLEHLAHTDKLTNTFNRNYFDREFKRYASTKQKYPELDFTVFLIDVNGLKDVNDRYGHKEGDNLIIKVAGLLKSCCRKTDLVARLGGDEFVILCPETKQADPLLDRIRRKEQGMRLSCQTSTGERIDIPIRMSIGIASTQETHPHILMKRADEKMYENKRVYYQSHQSIRRVSSM